MQVMDRLSCCGTDIDADIVSVRIMILITDFLTACNQLPQINQLVIIDIEITGKVAVRYDKEMARAGRVQIISRKTILTLGNHASTRF